MTPERHELSELVRRFIAEQAPLSSTRDFVDIDSYDTVVWDHMGKDLGLQGLSIPEKYGGLGCGPVEVGLVMEQLGSQLYNGPYLSSICMAATALMQAGDEEHLRDVWPGIASGTTTAALAVAEPGGSWDGATATTRWTGHAGTYLLSGHKTHVVDGASADLLVVFASRNEEPAMLSSFLVRADAPGVVRTRLPTFDETRSLADITFVDSPAILVGALDCAGQTLRRTLQQVCILVAAEQLGAAQRCLDMAVEYARDRTQFGRAIGSFQAIKHRCANTLLEVENARSAVLSALADLDAGIDLTEAASFVRACCSEVYSRAAATNIQVHGGIGFTWEHDAHLYLKRAKSSETMFGNPAEHRERLARAIGL